MSLRWRLTLSYLLVLAVTLGVISTAFVLILGTRPAPPQPTYQRLAAIAQSVDLAPIVQSNQTLDGDAQHNMLEAELNTIAEERAVRILLIDLTRRNVTFDSAGIFVDGDNITMEADVYTLPATFRRGVLAQIDALFGNFNDPTGANWVFVAIDIVRRGFTSNAVVFADQTATQSFQDVLRDFAGALLPLLCQSGAVGGVVAVILAGAISRTIARPLQGVAQAAAGMASGNYAERVPVTGPSEVRAVAEAFNNMGTQVETAQQAQQDFLANVSHDLKTPLTSIQGFSQAIIDGAASDPVSAARIIHEEASRLNRMVVELTDLARLQAGRLSMRWSAVEVGQLVSVIAERLQIVAREKQIILHIDVRPMPEIAADGDRLAQVFTNLISNAIKYTQTGGHVWIKSGIIENGVQISIRDNGIGISPQELPRIFERFYQVDKARGPQRGTGLGLAIVAEIVQAHGGKIAAYSDGEGRGSTFTVWLPSPQMSTILRKR